jgi:ribosomal protein S18 acetylase RimI-like enzyme
MTEEVKHGLLRRSALTPTELAEIEQLAHICNTCDGLDLKLNWDVLRERATNETNDFLYYEQDRLVGYLPLFAFNSHEAEISGMVHPDYRRQGIFSLLLNVAKGECRRRGLSELLLIVERASESGQTFAASQGARFDHSEYRMALGTFQALPVFTPQLEFRPARPGEGPILAQITAAAFGIDESEIEWYEKNVTAHSGRRFYVALLDGVYIGKLDVSLGKDEALIYGFGVLPAYQHRGYGRQILVRTVQAIQEMGQANIALEVAVENDSALSLYQSCGFYKTSSYDYYRIPVGG